MTGVRLSIERSTPGGSSIPVGRSARWEDSEVSNTSPLPHPALEGDSGGSSSVRVSCRHRGSAVLGFVARRVMWSLVVLLIVATVAFVAVNVLLPYDFAIGQGGRRGAIESIRAELGLDRSLFVRWLDYLWHLIRGDLGQSYYGFGVTRTIWDVLPTTVMIFAVGGIIAYLIGESFGRWVAWSRNRWFRGLSTTSSVLMFTAFPPWLVFLLLYFGGERLFQLRSGLGLSPATSALCRRDL